MVIYEYVMTDDTGFAPNPFYGICTLACCKPVIRRGVAKYLFEAVRKEIFNNVSMGDVWELFFRLDPVCREEFIKKQDIFIIGLAGRRLAGRSGGKVGQGDIVYIMRVTDILTFDMYFESEIYKEKIPAGFDVAKFETGLEINDCGDNIYHGGELAVERAFHHIDGYCEANKMHDLSGEYVLIADQDNFIYYGKEANADLDIGEKYSYRGQKKYENPDGKLSALKEWFDGEKKGIFGFPIDSRMEDFR